MSSEAVPYIIAPMRADDIPQVLTIEHLSFPTPWSAQGYEQELRNTLATYWVLRPVPPRAWGGVVRQPPPVIGYTGYWLIADEQHISTIAVHPRWRRRHLGEWLLLHAIADGTARGATLVTLEVRLDNEAAQALYRKYGFEVVGQRKRYYRDGMDALLMTLFRADSPEVQERLAMRRQQVARELARHTFTPAMFASGPHSSEEGARDEDREQPPSE
nr:ribosomal protein S18-alanine N-acetyltransferase [Ardenticatena sp.]